MYSSLISPLSILCYKLFFLKFSKRALDITKFNQFVCYKIFEGYNMKIPNFANNYMISF